ncbi:hypothetical protein TrCOL_g11995 [Triparma columacea]|uniref:NTP pyrophosphohydrolase MazG-like domain-containing protein n=1 Tax=Triparma columacea TaxID=722753 RepID=A0A9W7G8M7_9STRA|nr:hypothetical protein TrCOL_g11995 [Triparma columacea]
MSYIRAIFNRNSNPSDTNATIPADLQASWESLTPSSSNNNPRQQTRLHHLKLRGVDRMENMVKELGEECPWTKEVGPELMLSWLKSECKEVGKEIKEAIKNPSGNLASLKSELGDILFDAHMLNSICSRSFSFPPSETFEVGCKKVERRTPYMKSWGDGTKAETVEEAEKIWQQVKR